MKISNRIEPPARPVLTPLLCALSAWLLLTADALALDAAALPGGGAVTAGAATISKTGSTLGIQQSSQRAAIDWQSFNIGSAATVNFVQPNSSSVALNRITGNEASQIFGKLNANGLVFFSNPNGMLFARGSEVNVGGLLATTLRLNDESFMAGEYTAANPGAGDISNAGILNARGSVALVGNAVHNSGQIFATTVTLASGNAVAVDLTGDGLIRARIAEPALRSSIENSGSINASVAVTLTAGQSQSALGRVVNNTGVIRATGFASRGGEIVLEGATVENTGSIIASGNLGGGTIKLMGDMQGGRVRVGGTLDASAPVAGDGGFVETSAARVAVADSAHITTTSAKGRSGTWLIDPNDYTVAASGGDISGAALGSSLNGGNVTIQSSSGAVAGNGDIFVNDPVSWSSGNTLTLSAARDINIPSTVTATGSGAGLMLNANLGGAGGASTLTGTVTLNGGALKISGGNLNLLNNGKIVGGTLTSNGANHLMVGTGQNWGTGTLDSVVLDADATVTDSNVLRYDNTLTIANGHKITLASTGSDTWLSGGTVGAKLLATGGVGEVIFGGTSGNNYAVEPYPSYPYATNPYVLTIGPNVLIHGPGSGTIGYLNTVVNQGTIQTDGGTITLYVTDFSNAAGGVVNVNSGDLNLRGDFNSSGFAGVTFNRNGGSVNLTGTMTNTGNVFSLDGIGTLTMLNGSKIVGGTLTSSNGTQLMVGGPPVVNGGNVWYWGTGTLDSVVLDVDTTITNSNTLRYDNSLTIANGHRITLASTGAGVQLSGGTNGAQLLATGGIGQVVFAGTSGNNFAVNAYQDNPYALTIGPNVLIHGAQEGTVGSDFTALTNKGTIQTDTATVGLKFSSFANAAGGVVNVNSGGALNLSGNFNYTGLAGVTFNRNGGSVNLTGTMTNTGNVFSLDGIGTLNMTQWSSKIVGGALTSSKGYQLVVGNSQPWQSATLDGVVLDVDTIVSDRTELVLANISSNSRTIQTGIDSNIITNNTNLTNAATGTISGLGTLTLGTGTLTNNGTIIPGGNSATGRLKLVGNLINNGTIQTRIGGPCNCGDADVLEVSGNAALGGTLTAKLVNGFTPTGQSFDVLVAATMSGGFTTLNLPAGSSSSAAITGTTTKAFTLTASGGTPTPLPTLDQCLASPAILGCSAVLPSLAICTASPTTPGCSIVVPSLTSCIATPTLSGCSSVLPSLTLCTTNPATQGCTVVLPSLSTCSASPTTAGCSAVLPSASTCAAVPTTPGCTTSAPTLTSCIATPTLSGCASVLPSLALCATSPATLGCTVVLPSLSACMSSPTATGCSAVLPSVATCAATPSTPGCSALLPSIAACISNPGLAGCNSVLPALATCTAAPSTVGCSVVLPTFATCIAIPATAGCQAVLPTIASCVSDPSVVGCSAVLPTLATCIASPSTGGCAVVLVNTSSQTVTSQVTTITQSAIQGATSATNPNVAQAVPVTVQQTQSPSATPAPIGSADSSAAGSVGTTSGTSAVSATTPTSGTSAVTSQTTSTAPSTETVATVEEKVIAKPVITTVVVANTTVQKPAEQVVQPAQAKGKVLICKR